MKRLFLGIVLPLLCLITLVSSGFATWFFGDNLTNSTSATISNITVEKYAQVGTIELIDSNLPSELKLDQPTKTNTGITLNREIKANYIPASSSKDPSKPEYNYAQNLMFVFTCEITIPTDLVPYIKLNADYKLKQGVNGEVIYYKEFRPQSVFEVSTHNALIINTKDFIYNNVPANFVEYDNLRKLVVLNTNKIKINFSAQLTGEQFTK